MQGLLTVDIRVTYDTAVFMYLCHNDFNGDVDGIYSFMVTNCRLYREDLQERAQGSAGSSPQTTWFYIR